MKKIVMLMVCVTTLCIGSYGQKVKSIPVTTSSPKALEAYNEAMENFLDADISAFNKKIAGAIKEDPDFFMAHYLKAMFAAFMSNEKTFTSAAVPAIASKARLSKGEQLMRDAIIKRVADKNADLTEIGNKLVSLYPQDMMAHLQMAMFQYFKKDWDGVIVTDKKMLELNGRKDFIYNSLAYMYMEQGKYDEAEKALDKYIEMKPGLPNPYDSKGDLYMRTKQYDKAYASFMKANQIDSTWSKGKMTRAKTLAADMVVIGEVQEIMKNIKKGLSDLDADVVFKNADKEHFWRFVSNGKVSDDFNATLTGFKEIYSNYKNARIVFTDEGYRVLSPTTVLFTGNFSEEATDTKGGQFKIQGAMTVIFLKAGGHWNMSYAHQSYFPVQ
jgi:tetratricopeptide (TPR) repeat protein